MEIRLKIGYGRVSTNQQSIQSQVDELASIGCEKTFFDHGVSGGEADRPGLREAIEYSRAGDAIVVTRLDRLGRSLKDLVGLVAEFESKGIELVSLHEAIDTTTSTGRLVLGIFASLAEFERNLIRERTKAGLEAAKRNGRIGGRPRAINSSNAKVLSALQADGSMTVTEMANQLGCSPSTVYRHLAYAKRL